jgi:hypothetical protein
MNDRDGQVPKRSSKMSRGGSSGSTGLNGQHDCPDPIELILYVSAHSPRSASALAQIKRVLRRYKSLRVKLTICDLGENRRFADGIAVTPALLKHSPGPRTFILGHATNPGPLLELLETCDDT